MKDSVVQQHTQAWHTRSVTQTLADLHTSEHGLSQKEAVVRVNMYGANKLPDAPVDGPFVLFARQFKSPLIYILLIASVIVMFLGERMDAYIILCVLVANAVIGFLQEGKAQNTLSALKHFATTDAVVLRDGREVVVPDTELVPGDVIVLREGNKVSADARLIEVKNCKVDESALTGESGSVIKDTDTIEKIETHVADRHNMVFKGTFLATGAARAVVVATGITTVIGGISQKIVSVDSEAPLKKDIEKLSRVLSITVLVASVIVFAIGLSAGNSPRDMFFTSVAVAVSLIPEGLPIVITLVLATGVYRMAKRNALVKKLQAVEALGQARIVAVDKTGTITKNELMVERVFVSGSMFTVSGSGYDATGDVLLGDVVVDPANHPELLFAGKIATFCADARVSFLEKEGVWKVSGDPTEAALLVFGEKVGFDKDDLEREEPLVLDIPFDAVTKFHTTIHDVKGASFLTVVGAPEAVISRAHFVWDKGKARKITAKDKELFESYVHNLSWQGLRVLAFSMHQDAGHAISVDTLPPLTLVGLFGMRDVLRPAVADSVRIAQDNGVTVVMITGDHKATAEALAREAGIFREGDKVLTGAEIESMTVRELSSHLGGVSVFARVTPEHKLNIIEAYRLRGDIVAMTGDGVNDALSLVAADLGIAMGNIGTEVTKEAADIVLLDDNFNSIVAAIEEGRNIYATIRKVLLYLFSTGIGELLVVVGALLLSLPLPLLPSQILWLNLVTDGFLVVAMAMEPREGLLGHTKKVKRAFFIDTHGIVRMIIMGAVMMVGALVVFNAVHEADIVKGWTMALTTLAVFQWCNAWNCRSESKSIFGAGIFSNLYLVGATVLVVVLQLLAVYTPFLQKVLHTSPLTLAEWAVVIAVALSIVVVEEARKYLVRLMRGFLGKKHLRSTL